MKAPHSHLSHNLACLLFALAASFLVLGGCDEPGPSATVEHAGSMESSESTPGSAAHSHDNPNETCFICDPSKRDKGRLWCNEHGRYEDRCWICHPELEDKDRLFCKEHALYEDECFLCHPELKTRGESAQNDRTGTRDGRVRPAGLFCNEHRVPESECAICRPDHAASLEPGENMKVRFPSLDAADKAGIRTQRPARVESAPAVKAFCESQYNLNATARVTPLAGGVIREVRHDIGDRVEGGETLVVLHSADVASAKSDYSSARIDHEIRRQTFEREKRLRDQAISAEREYLDAEAAYRTSRLTLSNLRQKLFNLGLIEDEILRIEKEQDASAQLEIRAPFDGTLVERTAVVGEAIEVGRTLFTIADLSTHWLALSIPSDCIDQVRLGQTVEAQFPELPNATYTGRITWVDTSVDPRSRMLRARALFTDRSGRMKAGMFGEARILTSEAQPAALVPREAVQRHEGLPFVFVQNESDLFSLRRVSIGGHHGDGIIVMAGLAPNEPVVTEGSFIVMSEFLKSRLGAGCVDE